MIVSVGVAAVVWRDGQFLLIRRGKEPNRGLWAFPGGSVRFREPVMDAAARELLEETGVLGERPSLLTPVDVISPPEFQGEAYHFVLVPVFFHWLSGEGAAGDDAEAVRWCDPTDMQALAVVPTLWPVLEDALALLRDAK